MRDTRMTCGTIDEMKRETQVMGSRAWLLGGNNRAHAAKNSAKE